MSLVMYFYFNFVLVVVFSYSVCHAETSSGLFLLKKKGYRLKNSVMVTIRAETQLACASQCAIDRFKCKSFNFIVNPTVHDNCELNSNVGQNSQDEDFVANTNAKYYEKIDTDDVLPCESSPCQNAGMCSNQGDGSFNCTCAPGWTGLVCAEEVLPCEPSPCQNEGICSKEGEWDFKCTCTPGWTGIVCNEKEFLSNSLVLQSNTDWILKLKVWLPVDKQGRTTKLCYRASRDGWASSTFHSSCDDKGPTIVLVKCGTYVFGGYAAAYWSGSGYHRADASFIFSFYNKDLISPFKSQVISDKYAYTMYRSNGYGPTFGGGHDIYIANNAGSTTASYTNFGHTYQPPNGYVYASTEVKNLLAGTYNFKPDDVEVYYFANY